MFIHTKYSRYSDSELLSLLDGKIGESPIIDELVARYNKLLVNSKKKETAHKELSLVCPTCEATAHLVESRIEVDGETIIDYKLALNPVVSIDHK